MRKRLLILATIGWVALTATPAVHRAGAAEGIEPPGPAPGVEPVPPPPRQPNLAPEQEAELLAMLKDKRPDDYNRLVRLRDENPRDYRWALGAMWRAYQQYRNLPADMQKVADQAQQARIKAWRLSREMRAAKDDESKTRLRAELTETLQIEFDAEQKMREYHLAQLEEQIKRLAAEVKERAQQRDHVIEENLTRLLEAQKPDRAMQDRPLRPEGPRGEGPRGDSPLRPEGPFRGRATSRPRDGAGHPAAATSRPAE